MNISQFSTYKKLFLDYLKDIKKVSENTHKSYFLDLEQFTSYWQDHKNLYSTDEALEQFFQHLYSQEQKVTSIARKVSCFNSLKNFLKAEAIALKVPVKRPFIRLAKPVTISSETICKLLDTITNEQLETKRPFRDRAILELLYATAIRVSELIALEIGHINFDEQTITIRTKKKQERIVYFGSKAHTIISHYLHYERRNVHAQERLFLNHLDKPLTARSVQRICAMFSKHLKMGKITPGILRNSCASHLLSNGAEELAVQKLLGHKIPLSTHRYKKQVTP